MSFCSNCGQRIEENTKFCTNCGARINATPDTEREQTFEGNIHKCPNCGEVLPSFVANCPSCGFEIRGKTATASVKELYSELNRAVSVSQKNYRIRNFPIPNSKEDILEFMILASSNIFGESDKSIYEAWLAKLDQTYQKAELVFKGDADFAKIQSIYENCWNNIHAERQRRINKYVIDIVIRNIAVCVGIMLMVAAVIVDHSGGDSSLMEMIAFICLIASAVLLIKRKASFIDYVISAVSGLLMIPLAFLFDDGSVANLTGTAVLIIVAVNYFKSLSKPKE